MGGPVFLTSTRVPQDQPYIQALGTIDELTSHSRKDLKSG